MSEATKLVHIIGAGLAGLIAANMFRSSGYNVMIFEKQPEVPNNHSAVLRFRSSLLGDVLGIPFKKVTMIKGSLPWANPIADAINYSMKTNGEYRTDRSILSGLVSAERYIAPPDLIERLAEPFVKSGSIEFNYDLKERGWDIKNKKVQLPVISTIPMPTAIMTFWPASEGLIVDPSLFGVSKEGFNVSVNIQDCDAYLSLLIPDPQSRIYRISITGKELVAETIIDSGRDTVPWENGPDIIRHATSYLEIDEERIEWDTVATHSQKYAKIVPVEDRIRKNVMYELTSKFNVYSLGRYATWRPGLLLDDLVNDVRLIQKWIESGSLYDLSKKIS